jgi:diguanylate cyclase (GGDEF)-like protein
MAEAHLAGRPTSVVDRRPPALVAALYLALAVSDLALVGTRLSLLLAGAAVGAAVLVLALHRWLRGRPAPPATAVVAVPTLAAHVAAAPSRPLVVVLMLLAAASAWAAVAASGMERTVAPAPGPVTDPGQPTPASVEDGPAGTVPAEEPEAEPAKEEPDVREHLMQVAAQLVDGALVSLVEPDGSGALVVSAATEPGLVGLTFEAGSTSAVEHTYRTGRRLFLPDPRQDPLVSPTHLHRTRAASMLWQPVRVSDVPCAVLVVAWPERVPEVPQPTAHAINLLAEEAAGFLAHESMLADLDHFESTDVLTGLDSRAAWDAQLDVLMADSRESGQSLVVAIVDLDHFRDFNGTHGHAAGDAHLARFARAARATLRCDGLIARWGGEEFAVALTAITPQAAARVLDRVRLAVPDGRTCSIGFAVWDHHETGVHLLSRADRGLHRAKAAGRNRICQAS